MKIVFLDAATLGGTSLLPIGALGELTVWGTSSPEEAVARVRDADILIVNKIKVTAALMDAAPELKLICEAATGVNNIDIEAAEERGISVKNVAGYSTASVVQLTFALILGLVNQTSRFDAFVKSGGYSRCGLFTDPANPSGELYGKTLGIIGMGAIGTRVAQVGQAFGMKPVWFSTSGTGHNHDYPCLALEELLGSSDVVSIHCPLTERTKGLIGEAELALMKPDAILVNMARGGIVDEGALSDAVGNGRIGGAAMDVFTSEPIPEDNPLLHCRRPERLLLTPHVAWASGEAMARLVDGIAENIRAFLQNRQQMC